eukprot:883652-Lingulodinium_polyedra.AAC.1
MKIANGLAFPHSQSHPSNTQCKLHDKRYKKTIKSSSSNKRCAQPREATESHNKTRPRDI